MKNVAIIPARGGSKRIFQKNIKPFCGKPIIAWPIEAALKSGLFDRVVVSTDDEAIIGVARECGAEVLRRPSELADDYAGVLPVVSHAIHTLGGCEKACLIYATAPFVRPADLKTGLELLGGNDFALSVTPFESPIFRALKRDENGLIAPLWPEYEKTRSQDLPVAWHDAGQFCWGRAEAFLENRPVFSGRTIGVPIPPERVQDIDTPEDWARAEAMFRALGCA